MQKIINQEFIENLPESLKDLSDELKMRMGDIINKRQVSFAKLQELMEKIINN